MIRSEFFECRAYAAPPYINASALTKHSLLHFCTLVSNDPHHFFPFFLEGNERLERILFRVRQIMGMINIVERLTRVLWLIFRQVIHCQYGAGVRDTLEEIILKERAGVRQITFALDRMIAIPILAVGDLGLLVAKPINILAQGSPDGVRAWRRLVPDDQVCIHDEAFAQDV